MTKQLGFDKAPDRYQGGGRETIDRIRDAMTDREFYAFCHGQVIKYSDRQDASVRSPQQAREDGEKRKWYSQMMLHVGAAWNDVDPADYPDPRWQRPNFHPYTRYAEEWAYYRHDSSVSVPGHPGDARVMRKHGEDRWVAKAKDRETSHHDFIEARHWCYRTLANWSGAWHSGDRDPIHADCDWDPDIRDVVAGLIGAGFTTTDSGDGSKHGIMDCALPFQHVVVQVAEPGLGRVSEMTLDVAARIAELRPREKWQVEFAYTVEAGEHDGVALIMCSRMDDVEA